jgi:hypothetical protein
MDEGYPALAVFQAGRGVDRKAVTGLFCHLLQGAQHLHLGQPQEQLLGKGKSVGEHQDDLEPGAIGSGHPGDQGPVDGLGAEILIFQVNQLLGCHDGVDKEVADFMGLVGPQLGNGCLGPAQGHLAGGQGNRLREVAGEGKEGDFALRKRQFLAARVEPALGEQLEKLLDHGSGMIGLDVVI